MASKVSTQKLQYLEQQFIIIYIKFLTKTYPNSLKSNLYKFCEIHQKTLKYAPHSCNGNTDIDMK